ncbi:MAG TPA: hypothetical protein VGE66_11310 [Chitinophagaceae bacterium]
MILRLLIAAAILSSIMAVYGFIQFVRFRMKEQEQKEKFYYELHAYALFILFLIGIVVMLYMGSQP